MIIDSIVIVVTKTMIKTLRLFGWHGSALPGFVAEKIRPDLLPKLLGRLPKGYIVITGTNGKTTTTKILSQLLQMSGYRVLTNKSGSNFTRGILASLIDQASISGKLPYDIAIIEVDEAYSRLLAEKISPRICLVLNVLRDQLDRYGEIDTTASLIGATVERSQEAVLNADDPPVANLGRYLPSAAKVTYFGLSSKLRQYLPSDSELLAGVEVGSSLDSSKSQQKPDVELIDYRSRAGVSHLKFRVGNKTHHTLFNLDGIHNAANAAAALAAFYRIHPKLDGASIKALAMVKPAFGRGEDLKVGGVVIKLGLVKNPAGFNQNLRSYISSTTSTILIAINDRYADGRDVSWLWDVDFTPLKGKGISVVVSGIRAYDMALRLQYDGIEVKQIVRNLHKALRRSLGLTKSGNLVILPTYTAMLEIRKKLAKHTEVHKLWQ